ncbi:uncharacterized protein GGS22DRAFT_3229 [Annulohypoxylon maeteangense]|uniref:uncharacterized protein n=1 Tax=Annulohypoxylon maeteangense TaxID=1927788 RepID=UPI002008083F|nr:uncharacterized protein GGS22DRAFT_3229 [Annulohypoxylon maeteangense]KAI0889725.1 hypothetical protein GGS22DRAFT_3229 [Annulohypoxylon maeteangense]
MESATKKKLPFKRTARRKSIEVPNDDGLSLFSRSGDFFEEHQRLLNEKAEKEKAEKEKAEKAREAKEAKEAKAKHQRKERLVRESEVEHIDLLDEKPIREPGSAKKRRRISIACKDEDEDAPDREYKPPKKQRSPSLPLTPTSKRRSSFASPHAGGRFTRSHARTSLISLKDEDDDPFAPKSPLESPSIKPKSVNKPIKLESKPDIIALDDDSDPQDDTVEGPKEDEDEDPSEYYIRLARERAQKEKAEREAREKRGDSAAFDEEDPIIQILIHSHMRGINPLMFRRRLSQKLNVVYQTWIEQQIVKRSNVPRLVLESMFFTWKGNKVYPHTTLKTLGIKPERDGGLYPDWKPDQEGYQGRDKVYFEAWTQQLYDEYLEEKEKQRLQHLNELEGVYEGSQEPEPPQTSQDEKKIRVHFKAKDRPPTKVTVRSSTTAAQLVKAYRRLASIPEDKTIELHWDGEVLEDETTVEEADIEDMDSLEVHIK